MQDVVLNQMLSTIVNQSPIEVPEPSPPCSWVPQPLASNEEIATPGIVNMQNSICLSNSAQCDHYDVMHNRDEVLSNEEDEDFTVHFVHHGRKSTEPMTDNMDLLQQINQLQEVVGEMKGSLTEAMLQLGGVVEDSGQSQRLEETRTNCETNSTEILKLVLSLKSDFSYLKKEISDVKDRQDSMHKAINILLEDRRSLAIDLSEAGVISQHTRTRLECVSGVVEAIGTHSRSASGSHSNDSGVALLLEKAHNVFSDDMAGGIGQTSSDQDSLPDRPSLLVPSSVYEYVAGLSQPSFSLQSTNSGSYYPSLVSEDSTPKIKDKNIENSTKPDIEESVIMYDSDSSITIAANKTISLSTCLSQELRVNDDSSHSIKQRNVNIPQESEPSFNESKQNLTNGRRRRPLLGISSTAMYQPTHHLHHSSNGDKDKTTHYHKHRHKKDPQEMQRYKVARELLDTEKKYCKTLWTIQDTFAEPLKKSALLSNKDLKTLFPDEVYQLYDKHCLFQHQLRERLGSWKWHPIIGDILSRFTDPNQSEILRLYTSYVNDFPEVLKTFHRLCKTSQSFTNFIKSCLEQPTCGGLDLGAFLLSPVQRVPRYILLMKQLLKYTESNHPDYQQLTICLDRLGDFLARLNDAMDHSFRLVNSSLSLNAALHNGMANTDRNESPANIQQCDLFNGQLSSGSEEGRIPQRSLSSVSQIRNYPTPAGRSASLPRTCSSDFLTTCKGMSEKVCDTYAEPRSRSKIRNMLTVPSITLDKHFSKCGHITSAQSVTDITIDREASYGDLAMSEPSLLEPKLKAFKDQSAESKFITNVTRSTTPKLVTWTDSVNSMEDSRSRKKASIKSSIKNMFWFKKRGMGREKEEQIYWPTSISDITHIHSHSPPPTAFSASLKSTIGDFVDEEGNPCSNV